MLRVDVRLSDGEVQGTGFVVRSDSSATYVLTNRHVVEGASPASTHLIAPDGKTTYKVLAIVLNTGKPGTAGDLAVIKLGRTNIPPLAFGNSATLQPGESVASVGYGLAFQLGGPPSITEGIVSALARNLNDGYGPVWIQHQSTINHGNSGGPLLDLHGAVVGINTLSIDQVPSADGTDSVQGVFFAIPANIAKGVAQHLIYQAQHFQVNPLRSTGMGTQHIATLYYTVTVPTGWIVSRLARNTPVLSSRDQLVQVVLSSAPSSARASTTDLTALAQRLLHKSGTVKSITTRTVRSKGRITLVGSASYKNRPYSLVVAVVHGTGGKQAFVLVGNIQPHSTALDIKGYMSILGSIQVASRG